MSGEESDERTGGQTCTEAGGQTCVSARRARDAGVSSVEVVLLTPLIVMMILLIVSLGVMVNVRSEVSGAARDAARAGSLQGSGADAEKQAKDAVQADLGTRCEGSAKVDSAYVPPAGTGGGYYQVTVSCTVDMSGYGVFGAHKTFSKTFAAPIDPLQNFVPGDLPSSTPAPTPSGPSAPSGSGTGPPSGSGSPSTDQPTTTNTQFTVASWSSPTPSPTPTPTPTSPTPTTKSTKPTKPAGH